MQSKLCLVLALVVLVGALAFGNPFLPHGSPVVADGSLLPSPDVEDGTMLVPGGPDPGAASTPAAVGQLVSLQTEVPTSNEPLVGECPDDSLRGLVVRLRHDHAGEPIWELRDGRFVRANPRHGAGEPLVLTVDASVLEADQSFAAGK
ncbi:MAG: hypothetical protein IT456_25450 [Planctomycetes bacterium]|jgi:hypothetical protein|nr:hypothetical protein [Planctomycetota bacterium]